MECKGVRQKAGRPDPGDLIETLWNVKEVTEPPVEPGENDLIETLWNVKIFAIYAVSFVPPI